jgi:hypothetical protein
MLLRFHVAFAYDSLRVFDVSLTSLPLRCALTLLVLSVDALIIGT